MQRITIACATFIIAVFAAVDDGRAGLIIEAPSIVATPGSSGSFDVNLYNDNAMGGASYNIAGFSLELSLSGLPGVHFTAVDILTSIGYVFLVPGSENGGGPFSFDIFPNTAFIASDAEFGGLGYAVIAPGETYGLARVSYNVDPTAANGDRLLILDNLGTSLSDENGDPVAFMSVDGNVSVNGTGSVVPEPSGWVLLSTGLAFAIFARYRRARHTSSS